ncbi:MFS transporter [Streptomyces sp. NPDC060194]|uniref:MFS transporter n=1 Tax=Streptomyces sp. NPDC060194 TaxID=3347069 RepID=UPI00365030EB
MTQPAPGAVRIASATGRWILLSSVLGSAMALLDSTVVNVALPHIGDEFDADFGVLQWTSNAYLLTLSAFILLGGALSDRFGRRRIFVVGTVWFALASLLCGLAPDAEVLVAARALQGVGGALLTPGSLALIQAGFHPDDRARAVGIWSGLGGVGAAVGPFLGGWLVDGPGWRWVFLLNLPLAAICVPVALRHVPESRAAGRHEGFDVAGAALGALTLALFTYALISEDWPTGVLGLAAGVLFVLTERRHRAPMLPLDVFSSRVFTSVNVVTLLVYAAFGGFFFLIALHLQLVSGYTALAAGTALLPTTLLMLLLSGRSAALGERIGPRLPLTTGCLLAAAGMLLVRRTGRDADYLTDVLPGLVALGLGMVALVAPLTATVLGSVAQDRAGIASGVNNAVARAAGLIAVAALPLLTGMRPDTYRDPGDFDAAFTRALLWCALLLAAAAALSFTLLRTARDPRTPAARPACRTHCAVTAPPLNPGHQERDPGPRPPAN